MINILRKKGNKEFPLKRPLQFPLLAEGTQTGVIILFEDSYNGVIIYKGLVQKDCKGKRHGSKIPVTNTDVWRILDEDETIILSNNFGEES